MPGPAGDSPGDLAAMGPMDDHELLARIDERVEALQAQVGKLASKLEACEGAIIQLRVNAGKWGAIAGLVTTVLAALALAGVKAMAGQ